MNRKNFVKTLFAGAAALTVGKFVKDDPPYKSLQEWERLRAGNLINSNGSAVYVHHFPAGTVIYIDQDFFKNRSDEMFYYF